MACQKDINAGAIIFSTENVASINIMRHLQKEWNWEKEDEKNYFFSSCGKKECCSALTAKGYAMPIIQIEPEFEAEYYIYASTHKSSAGKPSLTVHIPGNWGEAQMGGQSKTLNIAWANKQKQILQLLFESAKKRRLEWQVSMEVDHHGPTPANGSKCLLFVEIGSTEAQWNDDVAGSAVAEAIMKSIFRPVSKCPAYIGIGGGHYAPKFTRVMLENEMAVGHILPQFHVQNFDEKMLLQAQEKTIEKIEGALVEWKGLKGEERKKVIEIIEKAGMKWKKI